MITYRKETPFEVIVEYDHYFGSDSLVVTGTYYYAPDEEYGEYPNIFRQDDSELYISHIYSIDGDCDADCGDNKKLEELVWEQLLSEK